MSASTFDECLTLLKPHGFDTVSTNHGTLLGRLTEGPAVVNGQCEATLEHVSLIGVAPWVCGPLLFLRDSAPRYVMVEHIFFLETPDIPASLLGFRDYVDYRLEQALRDEFSDISPIFGPAWLYLYSCDDLRGGLAAKRLLLSRPVVGNSLNARSDDLLSLVERFSSAKSAILQACPLPIVFGIPKGVQVGMKEHIYDYATELWYRATVKGDLEGDIAIADLASIDSTELTMGQHRYDEGKIVDETIRVDQLELRVTCLGHKFRSRRKLSRLMIGFT